MKQEVSLCLGRHSKAVTIWVACRSDHKSDKVSMAYTAEMDMNDESQKVVEQADDTWKASNW